MWFVLGSLAVAGAIGWFKVGAPLVRMLRVHDDVSRGGFSADSHRAIEAVETPADALMVTRDLQSLARSVGDRPVTPGATVDQVSKETTHK
jgi:hypothetical protein